MVVRTYIPDRGDIVLLDFYPQAGHEQAGMRPALVLSPHAYNSLVGLAICCPITSQQKGFPFEVALDTKKTTCVVLADHVKSLDYCSRHVTFREKASHDVIEEVMAKLRTLLF